MNPLVGFVPRLGEIDALASAGLQPVNVGGVWNVSDVNAAATVSAAYSPLAASKLAALLNLGTISDACIAKGFTFNGTVFQIDAKSVVNINAMGAIAIGVLTGAPGAAPWPTGFSWIAANNTMVPMSAAVVYAFSQTAANYVSAVVFNSRTLKNSVIAATDISSLNAINLNSGWP